MPMLVAITPPPPPAIIFFSILTLTGIIIIVCIRSERVRKRAMAAFLTERGFEHAMKPTATEKSEVFAPFAALARLKNRERGVEWWAMGQHNNFSILIMAHAFVVSTGKSSHTIRNLCIAVRGGGDGGGVGGGGGVGWPLLLLTSESLLSRIGEKLGLKADFKVEDEAFNKRWKVECPDEGFALAILSPEVQEVLKTGHAMDWWAIGGGGVGGGAGGGSMVCLGRNAVGSPKVLDEMLEHLTAVIARLPTEARAGLGV